MQRVAPNAGRPIVAQSGFTDRLSAFLRARPSVWVDGRDLAQIGGAYAWRTRVSELRRAPHFMKIENRQRQLASSDGSRYTVSEYRYSPSELEGGAVSGVAASLTAV